MCLALPVKVIKLSPGEMASPSGTALVDLGGVQKEISIALLDEVAVGDYVILHAGFALAKLDADEAAKTLALFAEMTQSGSAAS